MYPQSLLLIPFDSFSYITHLHFSCSIGMYFFLESFVQWHLNWDFKFWQLEMQQNISICFMGTRTTMIKKQLLFQSWELRVICKHGKLRLVWLRFIKSLVLVLYVHLNYYFYSVNYSFIFYFIHCCIDSWVLARLPHYCQRDVITTWK